MILVDLNQVTISNLMVSIHSGNRHHEVGGGSSAIDESLVRHMVLNSIRSYKKRFGEEFGEVVICCDDRRYWRREVFPHYKAHRRRDREKSDVDWTALFEAMAMIKTELREHMPYKVVQADRAEADDVIGAVCSSRGQILNTGEKILVVSGDKDFGQLLRYGNVYQYAPVQKKMIAIDNPERFLREHIILGDRGDGIPNFLSDDDTFVAGKRQRAIPRKRLDEWATLEPSAFCDEKMLSGYRRNEQLIDLTMIPDDVYDAVLSALDDAKPAARNRMFSYFVDKRLRQLTEAIGEF